ncbi:MAG: pentapeptide repeat-containing protein [Candidatus Caenarcaniphilales bacterium]|nr:pentapeptide repeat-containing protein [Candidatus Caenarcaniphilales bacterium]
MDIIKNYTHAIDEYSQRKPNYAELVNEDSVFNNVQTTECLINKKVANNYEQEKININHDDYSKQITKNRDGVNRTYYSAKAYLQVHEKVQELIEKRKNEIDRERNISFNNKDPIPADHLGKDRLHEIIDTIGNKAKETVEHINKLLSLNTGEYNRNPLNNSSLAPQLDSRGQKYIEESLSKELLAPQIKSGEKNLAEQLKNFSEVFHREIDLNANEEKQDFKLGALELAYMTAIELQNLYSESGNEEFTNPQNYKNALDKFIEKNNLSVNKEIIHKFIDHAMFNNLPFKGKVLAIKIGLDLLREFPKLYDPNQKKDITIDDSAKAIKAITNKLSLSQKILEEAFKYEKTKNDDNKNSEKKTVTTFTDMHKVISEMVGKALTTFLLKEVTPEQLFPNELLKLGAKKMTINKYFNQEPANLFNQRVEGIEKIREACRDLDSQQIEIIDHCLGNIEKVAFRKIIKYDPNTYKKPTQNWIKGIGRDIKGWAVEAWNDDNGAINYKKKDGEPDIYNPASLDTVSLSGPSIEQGSSNQELLLNPESQIKATLETDYKLTNKESILDTRKVKKSSKEGRINHISINKIRKNFNSPEYINKLIGVHIHDSIIPKAKFDYQNLSGAVIENTNARKASFKYASLIGTEFKHVDLTGADFSNADLQGVTFKDCLLDKTTWEKARLNNVNMENCVISDIEINEIDAKDWFLNHSVMNNLKLLGAGTGINIEGFTLLGSLFTNFTIADKDNLILNENGGIINRDDIRAQKIYMDVESLGSIIIGDDQEEKMNVKATALSEHINTPVKYPLTYLVNEYGEQTIEIYDEINDEEFGFLGMVNLVNNLDNKDLGVRYNL